MPKWRTTEHETYRGGVLWTALLRKTGSGWRRSSGPGTARSAAEAKYIRWPLILWKAAAVILVPVGIGWWYAGTVKTTEKNLAQYEEAIEPSVFSGE